MYILVPQSSLSDVSAQLNTQHPHNGKPMFVPTLSVCPNDVQFVVAPIVQLNPESKLKPDSTPISTSITPQGQLTSFRCQFDLPPHDILLIVPIPGVHSHVQDDSIGVMECSASRHHSNNESEETIISNVASCFPGTQAVPEKGIVMGGASDTVVDELDQDVEDAEGSNSSSLVSDEEKMFVELYVHLVSSIEELQNKLVLTTSFIQDLQANYTKNGDKFSFLFVNISHQECKQLTDTTSNTIQLNCSYLYKYVSTLNESDRNKKLFIPTRQAARIIKPELLGDLDTTKCTSATDLDKYVTIRWNTTIYSIGSIRSPDWSGGGKDPQTMFEEMTRRFASGSFRQIVRPQTDWKTVQNYLQRTILKHFEDSDFLWQVIESDVVRQRKVAFGPDIDMWVQLA